MSFQSRLLLIVVCFVLSMILVTHSSSCKTYLI